MWFFSEATHHSFVEENFMKLNAKKCEVVEFGKFDNVSCTVNGSSMTVRDIGKCLGFWWKKDLLASRCISENINKARKAFGYGSIGAFQGSLRPILSVSIIETCILPSLLYMYGAENWILTPVLIDRLESFQGELANRILCWPIKHHSNTAATLGCTQ